MLRSPKPSAGQSRPPRRAALGALALAAAAIAGVGPGPVSSTPATPSYATAASTVGAISFTVDDMDRSLAFYTGVLPFEKISDERTAERSYDELTGVKGPRRIVRLRLGDEVLELTDYLQPGGRPIPSESRSQDRWFQHVALIVREMAPAYRHLRERGVEHVSPSPQRLPDWNPNAGGIEAFYFKDPDHHVLEILSFPPDKGDPRWMRPDGRLFLGIDHTAIVVADTERSLGFYRDRLGLALAGESENHGVEQARLNNVDGAHLRITALRGPAGPGVEFLEYLSPTDGRPFRADARADDLVHWDTTVVLRDLHRTIRSLREGHVLFISPRPVRLRGALGALVRDPDGHAVRLLEKTS